MRKNLDIKQVIPIFYKRCYRCDEGVKFEKMWKINIGVQKHRYRVYLCKNCCNNKDEAQSQRNLYHDELLRNL